MGLESVIPIDYIGKISSEYFQIAFQYEWTELQRDLTSLRTLPLLNYKELTYAMVHMTLVELNGQAGVLGLGEDLCNLLLVVHCVLKFLNGSD